jgi:hypothetical protein
VNLFLLLPNFCRAFLRVNFQLIVTRSRIIFRFHARACCCSCLSEGILLRPRHWRENRLISISAWFSQLPCFVMHRETLPQQTADLLSEAVHQRLAVM